MARAVATYSSSRATSTAGEWGVAVQSKFLAVGAGRSVGRARGGRGRDAGARQHALRAERAGAPPPGALRGRGRRRLTEADEGATTASSASSTRPGRAATYTGASASSGRADITGEGYAAQGNILVSEETVSALARTFEAAAGRPLAERLLAALAAAQAAGGDRRGQQSAALLVVKKDGGYMGTSDASRTCGSTTTPARSRSSAALRHARPPLRRDARRRIGWMSTSSSPSRFASGSRPSATRATTSSRPSWTGPETRTSRNASRGSTASTPSSSPSCESSRLLRPRTRRGGSGARRSRSSRCARPP